MDFTIELVDKISDAEDEKMTKDLVACERAHGIDVNYRRFSLVMKDSNGVLFGVLNAFTAFAEIYVDDIWIDSAYRGKGFGRKLLQELENRHRGKGFNNINLVTSAFQAPGFYEKCGFQAEFVRENKKNPKLTKTFFVKFFDDEVQTQGIVEPKKTTDGKENQRNTPFIIGISGISGAGKSTLVHRLSETLQATSIFWDDYDEISQAPEDYVQWYSSKDYSAWVYPALVDTLRQLKNGETVVCPATGKKLFPTKYILLDAPLGYCHQATGEYIDFLICLDTALDIALARRLIRDLQRHLEPQKVIQELKEYLSQSRPLFILSQDEKNSDLILDGNLALEEQEKQVLKALSL